MTPAWTGFLDTDRMGFNLVGVVPARTYLLPPGRRTIRAFPYSMANEFNLYHVSWPRLALTVLGDETVSALLVNVPADPDRIGTTRLHPLPLPNSYALGRVCLSANSQRMPAPPDQLPDLYWAAPFETGEFHQAITFDHPTRRFHIENFSQWAMASRHFPDLGEHLALPTWTMLQTNEEGEDETVSTDWCLASYETDTPAFRRGEKVAFQRPHRPWQHHPATIASIHHRRGEWNAYLHYSTCDRRGRTSTNMEMVPFTALSREEVST